MLTYAVILFAVAAVGGLLMAMKIFRGGTAPWPLSILHAVLGAAGLLILLWLIINNMGGNTLLIAFGLLLVAALGGFFLASFHIRGVKTPSKVVVIHAVVAVAGFLALLSIVFGV